MRKSLSQVQMLRAVAAFLVMSAHLYSIDQKYAIDPVVPAWLETGMVGVDLFFVISGFIMAVVAGNAVPGLRSTLGFLVSRAGRIYPLYWLVSAALVVVWLYRPDLVFSTNPLPPHLITSFTLWPDHRLPILSVGWTLVHEMYFYVVFALLLLLPERLRPAGVGVWTVLVLIGAWTAWGIGAAAWQRIVLHPLTFEFIAGVAAGWAYRKWNGALGTPALLLGLSWVLVAAVFVAASGLLNSSTFWTDSTLRPALFAIPAACLVYGLASYDASDHRAPGLAVALGDQSYALYLTHILSLSLLGRLWSALPQSDAPWDNVVAMLIFVAAAYAVAEVAYRLLDRPIHQSIRALRKRMTLDPVGSSVAP